MNKGAAGVAGVAGAAGAAGVAGVAGAAGASEERRRRLEVLANSGVYLVTEESLSGGRRSEDVALAALAAGVKVIQVREKDGPLRRALDVAVALREPTRRAGALLIVNDRLDIALACDADGIHVGQDDLPVGVARALMGDDALIGLSITDASQLRARDVATADYLGVGAVYRTGSKLDATLTGLLLVASARDATAGPIVAIGGLDATNLDRAIAAGADVIAVISAITRASDPGAAAATLLRAVEAARVRRGDVGRIATGPEPAHGAHR